MPPKSRTSTLRSPATGKAKKPSSTKRTPAKSSKTATAKKESVKTTKGKKSSSQRKAAAKKKGGTTSQKKSSSAKNKKASTSRSSAKRKSSAATKRKAPKKTTATSNSKRRKKKTDAAAQKLPTVPKYRLKRSVLGVPAPHHHFCALPARFHLDHHHHHTNSSGGDHDDDEEADDASSTSSSAGTGTDSLLSSVGHEEEAQDHQFIIKGFAALDPVVMVDYVPLSSDERSMLGPLFHRGVANYYWQFCDVDSTQRPEIRPIVGQDAEDDNTGNNALVHDNYDLELSRALEFAYAAYIVSPSGGLRTIKTRNTIMVVDFQKMMHLRTDHLPVVAPAAKRSSPKLNSSTATATSTVGVSLEGATNLMPRATAPSEENTSASPNFSFAIPPQEEEDDDVPPPARLSQLMVGGSVAMEDPMGRLSVTGASQAAAALRDVRDEVDLLQNEDDAVAAQDEAPIAATTRTYHQNRILHRMYRL